MTRQQKDFRIGSLGSVSGFQKRLDVLYFQGLCGRDSSIELVVAVRGAACRITSRR